MQHSSDRLRKSVNFLPDSQNPSEKDLRVNNMSLPEQDLERGPERSMAATPTPNIPTRETAMSPPPMAQSQQREPSMLNFQPGVPPQADNQYLSAFRYHLGIYADPSLNPVVYKAPTAERVTSLLSVNGLATAVAKSLNSSNTAISHNGMIRPAPNLGIYQRVVASEQQHHKEYKVWSLVINGALGLQIIFAAALTALGAGNGPHSAITAFGAMNTVLAGLLTFLKGSGLPNRVKYYENSWTKVREYIEQRERDFASDSLRGKISWEEVTGEIATIEAMYETVRRDIEANTPESYISLSTAMKAQGIGKTEEEPVLKRGISQLTTRLATVREDAEKVEDRIRSGITEVEHRFSRGRGDIEKAATVEVREFGNTASRQASYLGKQVEDRYTGAQNTIQDNIYQTQNAANSRLHDIEQTTNSGITDAQLKLNDAQLRLKETQHDSEAKFKEMEHKIEAMAAKAAEKVLEMTKNRHAEQQH